MAEKRLIVAIEGTAAVGPYWKTIVSDYLEKIIRSFFVNDSTGQKRPSFTVELSLVVFNAHGSYNACVVQRSGWTRDAEIFFQWLSAIPFAGGGFNDAAIAEGLSEALMMFSPLDTNQAQQNVEGQNHCILVAASNPYPLPTPVFRPQLQKMERSEDAEARSKLSDAETIAKYFPLCSVSLSIISPKQLPKLKAIYNAGTGNHPTDPPIDITKNPNFLVLISGNLTEGRAALSRSVMENLTATQSLVEMDTTPPPPVPLPPTTSMSTGNDSGRPVAVGNVPLATVKVEPPTVTSMAGPVYSHMSSVPRSAAPAVTSQQTSSPISASQDMISSNTNVPEMKPVISSMAQAMHPVGPAAANVRILNDVAQARQALAGSSSIGLQSMAGTPTLSNTISSGMPSSVPAAQSVVASSQSAGTSMALSVPSTGSGQPSQSSAPSSLTSATTNVPQNSNLDMSQPLNYLCGTKGQSVPAMNQADLPNTQIGQSGMNMNQNMLSAMDASGMLSATGAMMPTPGISQPVHTGMQQLGDHNSTSANMHLSQQTSAASHSAQSKYVKVWEGELIGQRHGQPVFISKLEGYRSASASESLAANWPLKMQINRLISQEHMNNKKHIGKADYLVFRAMNRHGFLAQLQEKKLCAVIQLPSQTLLLSVSDKACRLIGMLFPGDMVVFKPQIPGQQQPQQQQLHISQLQPQQQQPPSNIQKQQPLMQLQQKQQIPHQLQQQQMASTGMGQTHKQGQGRSPPISQGQVSSQGASKTP